MRLWVFADFALPSEQDIIMMRDIGVSDVVLGVSTERNKTFKLNYTPQAWSDVCFAITAARMTPHLMIWAVPDSNFMKGAFGTLGLLYEECNCASIMLDAEGTWHNGHVSKRKQAMTAIATSKGKIPVGVTGLDKLHSTVKVLIPYCDYILPQAYSFWKPGEEKHWSHCAHTFPGPQQRRAYESWGKTFPEKPFVMGLAAYWGDRPKSATFPGMTDQQSMRYAAAETVAIWHEAAEEGSPHPEGWFNGVAYWSLKHIRGAKGKAAQRREFLRMFSYA